MPPVRRVSSSTMHRSLAPESPASGWTSSSIHPSQAGSTKPAGNRADHQRVPRVHSASPGGAALSPGRHGEGRVIPLGRPCRRAGRGRVRKTGARGGTCARPGARKASKRCPSQRNSIVSCLPLVGWGGMPAKLPVSVIRRWRYTSYATGRSRGRRSCIDLHGPRGSVAEEGAYCGSVTCSQGSGLREAHEPQQGVRRGSARREGVPHLLSEVPSRVRGESGILCRAGLGRPTLRRGQMARKPLGASCAAAPLASARLPPALQRECPGAAVPPWSAPSGRGGVLCLPSRDQDPWRDVGRGPCVHRHRGPTGANIGGHRGIEDAEDLRDDLVRERG